MKLFYLLSFKQRALLFAPVLLLLASCGSYQYSGYGSDGIYSSSEKKEAVTADDYVESYEESLYYKQLFAESAERFGNVPTEGAIFTDIDGYTSTGAYDNEMFVQEDLQYRGGSAPWGADPDEIAINIYGNNYPYAPYFDPYNPYMGYVGFYNYNYNPFFGRDFGRGYGFGYGYGYGYATSPWYGYPWRYSYGYYNSWGWNYWNSGWNRHPYYYDYGYPYSTPYYFRRNVAYNEGRRNSYMDFRSEGRSNADARSSRIQSYSNSRGVRADRSSLLLRSNRTASQNRTYSTRASRVETADSRSRGRSNSAYRSSSNTRSYERSTEARTTRRSNTYNNNSSREVRRSTSNSRSSGTVRSSSSSRSSGTSRSSGGSSRSSRGRGN
ncbi:hypothetical protein [Salinimicrobium sp. GXAS 041]|uniref:hypothetical protein n=1 Tax=Salinimicrobium sp. GXAS 041 TaxID=3400806 RepID=UPI003C789E7E